MEEIYHVYKKNYNESWERECVFTKLYLAKRYAKERDFETDDDCNFVIVPQILVEDSDDFDKLNKNESKFMEKNVQITPYDKKTNVTKLDDYFAF